MAPSRIPRACPLAGVVMLPVPGATDQVDALSRSVQAPPTSAEPQPLLTVRANVSVASTVSARTGSTSRETNRSGTEAAHATSITNPAARVRRRPLKVVPSQRVKESAEYKRYQQSVFYALTKRRLKGFWISACERQPAQGYVTTRR